MLDHPDTLNPNDQDEGDHEECPDGLKLQVVHLDGHNVPDLTNRLAPGDVLNLNMTQLLLLGKVEYG